MKKQTEDRLLEIARQRFGELLEDNSVPEDDIARLVIGTIKLKKSLMVRIDLLPLPRQIDAAEMLIDSYLDNKQLCTLEVDEETEQVTVTIINEMPWLRLDSVS